MSEEIKISQIKFEEHFIRSLLKLLKVGNRGGIHLNAVPGYARSRLDLKELDRIAEEKSTDFLHTLLSKEEFSYAIDFDGINLTKLEEDEKNKLYLISRRLNNATIDDEDQFLESGIKNFGFGYPLLIRRDSIDPTKIIKAPLIIWNLDIVKSNRKNNLWTISRTLDHPVRINELLRSHVLRDTQVSIEALNEEVLEDNVVDSTELLEICKNILAQLGIQINDSKGFDIKVQKCPDSKKIDSLATDNAWIQWSGIFGIYTSRKESIIRRIEEMLEQLKDFQNQKLVLDKFQTSTVSAVLTDPSKEEIINTLTDNEIKLIQGPPGTGKSQALTAIITNTLQNGGKCLVVCEKKTALNVIYNFLEKIGLSDLSVIVDDISRDRSTVVKKARSIVDNLSFIHGNYVLRSNLKSFSDKYSEFSTLKDDFNLKHLNERESKIGEDHWKDAVGRFIQFSNEIDWDQVKTLMPEYNLSMNEKDYQKLEKSIRDASIAYSTLDKDAFNLYANIKKDFFSEIYSRRISDKLKGKISKCNKFITELDNITSNLSESDVTHMGFDIFHIKKLQNELSYEINKSKLFLLYESKVNELYSLVKKITPVKFRSKLITEEMATEQIEALQINDIKGEIEESIVISRKNIEFCNSVTNIYSDLESAISDLGKISQSHKKRETTDSIKNIFCINLVRGFIEEEKEKVTVLEELLSTINLVKSLNVDEKILQANFVEKIKSLFLGNKSTYKQKIKIKNNIFQNRGILQSTETYDRIKLKKITSVLENIKNIAKIIGRNIDVLKNIEAIYAKVNVGENNLNKIFRVVFSGPDLNISDFKDLKNYTETVSKRKIFLDECLKKFTEYELVHNWINFYNSIGGKKKSIISQLKNSDINTNSWLTALRAWRYYNLLLQLEESSSGFHKDDNDLNRLSDFYYELKDEQKEIIKDQWRNILLQKIPTNFKLLYNLRKNRVHSRTNSLRKIINQDFDLFTSIFPVILTNPLAVDSMLPLELGIFDVVIFDEASQLRIEDTFTSLIRGKYKIIAGDVHQMPPSSYFQVSGDIAQGDELSDEELDNTQLALSESLLDYAENLGFQSQSYLDYHYRSRHPALIDFSNVAFYGGNLVPFPEKFAYKPIEFYEVNGIYNERVNEDEVCKVIDILKNKVEEKSDGAYPSVGIATFNIPQRNRIIDELNKAVINDENFAKKIDKIRESENGFFIKNLENIQGDEMDIIIISTTYGKDLGGKFYERFGPLNLEKGYKLLNVIITRAKDKIFICTSVPKNKYSNYRLLLEEYGNNKKAIFYAYLAYAKSISNKQTDLADQVKEDLIEFSHDKPRGERNREGLIESPFEQEVYDCLLEKFDSSQIIPQKQIGGFRVDFLVDIEEEKVVIECDGKTYHSTNEAYAHDMFRQKEIENLGYKVYRIWSTRWWHDHSQEINKLIGYLNGLKQKVNVTE